MPYPVAKEAAASLLNRSSSWFDKQLREGYFPGFPSPGRSRQEGADSGVLCRYLDEGDLVRELEYWRERWGRDEAS